MRWFLTIAATAALVIGAHSPADAGSRKGYSQGGGAHPTSPYYRSGPRVKGYVARRGGYSYNRADTVNTYGNSRSNYGSTNAYRDFTLDKQTVTGPFDHGFFFDSAIGPRGGDAPYMN